MSFDHEQVIEMLKNPLSIQGRVLQGIEDKLDGKISLVSPNTPAAHLMDSHSTITAELAVAGSKKIDGTYAKRITFPHELYEHMSDFELDGIYATPAATGLWLSLRKAQLINSAIDYNDNYKKAIIPKDVVFTIGGYKFSMYYPIEIKINKRTGAIIPSFDTSVKTTLQRLSNDTVKHTTFNVRGVEVFSLNLPIYQFDREVSTFDVVESATFTQDIPFQDEFYALRAETLIDGEWVPISTMMEAKMYSNTDATAVFVVDIIKNSVRVTIPQVHIRSGLIGTSVRINVLTTKGEVNVDLSGVTSESIEVLVPKTNKFAIDKYSAFLDTPELIELRTEGTKLVGGTSGTTFDVLRNNVIFNQFGDVVPISPMDMDKYFKDRGFTVLKYKDGLTGRIYNCCKEIVDTDGHILASMVGEVQFTEDLLKSLSTVNVNSDGTYTIKPKTIYTVGQQGVVPLDDTARAYLATCSNTILVDKLNKTPHLISLHHTRLDMNDGRCTLYPYDFNTPKVSAIEFVDENVNISEQISVVNSSIVNDVLTSDTFEVYFDLLLSEDLQDLHNSDMKVCCYTTTAAKTTAYGEATFVEVTDLGFYRYKLSLETDFDIDRAHNINVKSLDTLNNSDDIMIPINFDMNVVTFIGSNIIGEEIGSEVSIVGDKIKTKFPGFIPSVEQVLTIELGEFDHITSHHAELMFTSLEYERYTTRQYAVYDRDVYEEVDGVPTYTITDGKVNLNKLHSEGDTIYKTENILLTEEIFNKYVDVSTISGTTLTEANKDTYLNTLVELKHPIIIHDINDVVLNSVGEPRIAQGRKTIANLELLLVDYKVFRSQAVVHDNVTDDVSALIRNYTSTIKKLIPELLERTHLRFKPLKSIGTVRVPVGVGEYIDTSLEFEVALRINVDRETSTDNDALDSIREATVDIIDKQLQTGKLVLDKVANDITKEMSDTVISVDILGINGIQDFQTFIPAETDAVPSLKQRLTILPDNTLGIERGLDISFSIVKENR